MTAAGRIRSDPHRRERRELTRPRRSRRPRRPGRPRASPVGQRGVDYRDAAAVGRKAATPSLICRPVNQEGLTALEPRHGGGRAAATRRRTATASAEVRGRHPGADGTATRPSRPAAVPRAAPDACRGSRPHPVARPMRPGTATSGAAPGARPGRRRAAARRYGAVTDPDAEPKKSRSRTPTGWASRWPGGVAPRPGGAFQTCLTRAELAAGGRPGAATARVHPHGTAKVPTPFQPADGRVRIEGVTTVPTRRPTLAEAGVVGKSWPACPTRRARRGRRGIACGGGRPAWRSSRRPAELPPLRMLLVLDNLPGTRRRSSSRGCSPRNHAGVHPVAGRG